MFRGAARFAQQVCRDPDMTERDTILLAPHQQYKKYQIFPLKLVLHGLAVLFITAQAVMISVEFIPFNRANDETFRAVFLEPKYIEGIYSIKDCQDAIEFVVDNYYTFPNTSVNRYEHLRDPETTKPLPVQLVVFRYKHLDGPFWNHSVLNPLHNIDDDDFDGNFKIVESQPPYNLTQEKPLGPLNISTENYLLQDAFYHIVEMNLLFSFRTVNVGPLATMPVYWDIKVVFDIFGGQVTTKLIAEPRTQHTSGISGYDIFTAMNSLLLIVSVAEFLISLKEIYRNIRVIMRVRKRYKFYSRFSLPSDHFPTWETIPFSLKVHFFSFWSLFNAIASLIIIVACALGLAEEFGLASSAYFEFFYGLGCMLTCFNLIRYFEYKRVFFLHLQTLRAAAVKVIQFVLSVTPIYWGYIIFGVLNFGAYSHKFATLDETAVTLFALLTGDDVHDTFINLYEGGYPLPYVSRVYLFSFVLLFMTTVLNVFIFIIEDAYHQAKSYLKLDAPHPKIAESMDTLQFTADKLATIFDNLERWEERHRCVKDEYPDPSLNKDPKNVEMSALIHDRNNQSSSSSASGASAASGSDSEHELLARKEDSSSSLLMPVNVPVYSPHDIEDIIQRNHALFVQEITDQMKATQRKYAQMLRQELEQALGHPFGAHS